METDDLLDYYDGDYYHGSDSYEYDGDDNNDNIDDDHNDDDIFVYQSGWTPLMCASFHGHAAIVDLLLRFDNVYNQLTEFLCIIPLNGAYINFKII